MSRKRIILLVTFFLSVAAIAFLLYFVLIFRAEASLQHLVNSQSNGKLIFKAKKVNLDVFNLRFEFKEPELRTIDSSNTITGYHIKMERTFISVHSLFSLFSNKPLIVDSIIVKSPLIEVIKYKSKEGPVRKISLPEEMNKVYESLEKILKILNLNYLHISDAKFRVYDRSVPVTRPLELSNLYLTIDNVSDESGEGKNRFLHADRIQLEIYNQDILLPDGYHGIKFKRFWMGTRSQMIKLDSCYIYGKSNDSSAGEFSVFVDTLRIQKLDFNALTQENRIRFDSALCINPAIYLKLQLKDKGTKPKFNFNTVVDSDSIDLKLKKMMGNLDIGYVTVRNANVNIVTSKNEKTNVYTTTNSNFSFGGLVVKTDPNIPIELSFLNLNIHDYTGYSPDSLYMVTFDDVIIRKNKMRLNNFMINPSKANHDPLLKKIKMQAFELEDIDWISLLYENRIVAGHASLIKPEVYIVLPAAKGKEIKKEKVNPFEVLDKIQNKVEIGELFIEDGTMTFEVRKGPKFSMTNSYIGINVKNLLAAGNGIRLIDSFDTLAFAKGDFYNSGMHLALAGGRYSKTKSSLSFKQITGGQTQKYQSILMKDIMLGGIEINSMNDIAMSELSWGSAMIDIRTGTEEKSKTEKKEGPADYKINIKKINGGSTHLGIKIRNLKASTILNQITTGEIVIESGKKPQIKGLTIDGQAINLDQENSMNGSMANFQIADNKPSTLTNVMVKIPLDGETVSIMIPRLTFSADIYKSLNGKITAGFIELSKPVITFNTWEDRPSVEKITKSALSELPLMHIKRITVDQPELVNLPAGLSEKMHISPGAAKLDLLGINSDGKTLNVDSIHFSSSKPGLLTDKFRLNPTDKEKIDFYASKFAFHPANQKIKSRWSFNLNTLKMSGIQLNAMQTDTVKQTITINSLNLENLHINDSSFNNPEEFIGKNSRFRITNGNLQLENGKTSLKVYNLSLTKATNSLTLDSMTFYPVADREEFMKTQDYQTTHMQVHSGKINVKDIDFNLLLKDTVISLKKVTINDVHLLAYKDKRLPFHHGVYKPMLTDLLLNIKPKIQVDSAILKNGLIEYEEFNDKTQQLGMVKLSKIKGAIAGVRTFNPMPDDSLRFNMYARLIDTADIRINYKQSYTDSLSGFTIKLIVNSFNLTALNPILRPFASAELKSGYLDTIRMSVIGRKYLAYGAMKMYYNNLNAQLISEGDSSSKNAITKLISFFANRIVWSKNMRGTGDVFAERDSEKGFVNYWVKIVIGGVLTNSGVRSDKSQQRKYKKALNFHDVPPIPDIPADY